MPKKTEKKEKASNNSLGDMEEMTPVVCRLKHIAIDKEFENIKENAKRRHEEMRSMIDGLQENIKKDIKVSNTNLKDKIILTEKTIGDKIDSLSKFDDTLKGNGTPGIWESIRNLRWQIRGMISFIVIVVVLWVGGSIKGITMEKIKNKFGFGSAKTKQVESAKPIEETKLSAKPKD